MPSMPSKFIATRLLCIQCTCLPRKGVLLVSQLFITAAIYKQVATFIRTLSLHQLCNTYLNIALVCEGIPRPRNNNIYILTFLSYNTSVGNERQVLIFLVCHRNIQCLFCMNSTYMYMYMREYIYTYHPRRTSDCVKVNELINLQFVTTLYMYTIFVPLMHDCIKRNLQSSTCVILKSKGFVYLYK